MIKSIEVIDLYGYLDKKIEFNKKENFLIGINGSGKTSILKIIDSFFNDKEMRFLKKITFKKIEIVTNNNKYIIEKNFNNNLKILTPTLIKKIKLLERDLIKDIMNLKKDVPEIFIDLQKSSIETQICNYTLKTVQEELKNEDFLAVITEGFDDSSDENEIINLIKKIKNSEKNISEKEVLKNISPIKKAHEILEKEILNYLSSSMNLYEKNIDNLYEDNSLKINEFIKNLNKEKELLKKPISKFNKILNSFLSDSYKKIIFNDETNALEIKTLNDETMLSMDYLSSGEKHLIILFTYLCFKIQKNSTILIDEPEKSLHIEWQQNFIPQLRVALKGKGIQLIIATHSPYILKEVERKNMIGLIPNNEAEKND